MSLTNLIDDLTEKSAKLRSAMESSDVARIDAAGEAFWDSIEAVKAVGEWPATPELREKLAALRPQLEESRALAFLLADMTGQMHELAASKARSVRPALYGRTGERFA